MEEASVASDYLAFSTSQLDSHSGSPALQGPGPDRQTLAGLPFLPPDEWNQEKAYDEKPPKWIHLVVEWRLMLAKNRRTKLTGNTEQNVVVAPHHFWHYKLKLILDAAV